MKTKQTKEELEAIVHATDASIIEAAANRWTTENLGGVWPKDRWQDQSADGIDESEVDDWYDGLQSEFKDWQKEAKKHLKELKARQLPLTLANMELAFSLKLSGQQNDPSLVASKKTRVTVVVEDL